MISNKNARVKVFVADGVNYIKEVWLYARHIDRIVEGTC